uniref:DIS3 exosome endoribonuclease and 3'-5' exoribonuclease n=1 Tax=Astyanax mexicanus TaxID=7994 RepID=A0A8B9RBT4_ASTMX
MLDQCFLTLFLHILLHINTVLYILELPLETFIEREQGEIANDRNDRAIRVAAKWYTDHLSKAPNVGELKVVLLTNVRANKEKAEQSGLLAYRCEEYIKSLIGNPELVDSLALASDDQNDITGSKLMFPEHQPLALSAPTENNLEATVFIHGEGEDSTEVLLQGLQNLNRAVHQDLVAIELFPKERWVAPSSVVLQDDRPNDEDAEEEDAEKKLESTVLDTSVLKPTGRVVGIIKRNWRPFCGMLNQSQIKEATRHIFTPADRRIPRIRIETRQASTLVAYTRCTCTSSSHLIFYSSSFSLPQDLDIHTDSAKALADSLNEATLEDFPYFNTLLRILATRCMMQAVYFCSGMDSDFHHYGLASPIFIHFTSPIRRYSDIIVHRLLAVAINADSTYPDLMDKHNYRHKMAQYLFFKNRGILNEEGFILFVRKNAIIILIPKFGLEGTVFFKNKDNKNLDHGSTLTLRLLLSTSPGLGPTLAVEDQHTFHIFDKVKVTISLDASNIQHQKIRMALVEPVIPGVSVALPEPGPEAKKPKLDR